MDHQAFAQLLGNYGEFVGAVAVVLTLIYLAVQIRQNTRTMKTSALNAITSNVQTELNSTFMNPVIASAIEKSLSDPNDLSDMEIVHLQGYYVSSLMSRQLEFFQHKEELINDEVWESLNFATRAILNNDWARRWWQIFGRHTFASSFVSHIDAQLRSQRPVAPGQHFINQLRQPLADT